jgi:hypothetical protein
MKHGAWIAALLVISSGIVIAQEERDVVFFLKRLRTLDHLPELEDSHTAMSSTVFHKTYPETLFPIPFAKHCLVQLVNEKEPNWGNFWQLTYTIYPPGTPVKSLTWPLNRAARKEMRKVCDLWGKAQSYGN